MPGGGLVTLKRAAVQTRKEPAPGNLEGSKGVFLHTDSQTWVMTRGVKETDESQKESQETRVKADLEKI